MFTPRSDDLVSDFRSDSSQVYQILSPVWQADYHADTASGLSKADQILKRLFDLLGATVMIVLFSPVMICIAIAIWYRDGFPIVFGHERVGLGGRTFRCLKFRTMVRDSDRVLDALLSQDMQLRRQWNACFKLDNDPRIIPGIGHMLRKTSLDELPQLFNVFNGDMSLVGPRPIVAKELEKYGRYRAHYQAVKPGLTGLWQVGGRSATCYDARVGMDVWYVENASVWTDIAILFRTARMFVSGKLDGAQ